MIGSLKKWATVGISASIAAVCFVATSAAQTLPAVKTLATNLVSPATADVGYGTSTAHTNSTGLSANPVLIQELAKSLGSTTLASSEYKKAVFEYVYENIETEFQFGLGKGAHGALLDQSGTPFDIAHLTAELLREAGITASYQIGTITLNASEFGEWTGLVHNLVESTQSFQVSAAAACKFLAAGGIPATINGVANATCSYSPGTLLTTVTLTHVWVVSGTDYFDASFKQRTLKQAADLKTILGCGASCGDLAKTAMLAGAQSGFDASANANYLQSLNKAGLKSHIASKAQTLANHVNSIAGHITTEQLVGGVSIDNLDGDDVVLSSLPYTVGTTYLTISGDLPNQYRTTIRIRIDNIDKTLYLDEVNGYWLSLNGGSIRPDGSSQPYSSYVELLLAGRYDSTGLTHLTLATSTRGDGDTGNDDLSVTVNHPYRGNSGTYADETYSHDSVVRYQSTIHKSNGQSSGGEYVGAVRVNVSVGRTGEGRLQRDRDWSSSTPGVFYPVSGCFGAPAGTQSFCAVARYELPALVDAWRLQASQMGLIVDGVNLTRSQHLHSLGMLGGLGSYYDMTAVSSYGVTSVTDDPDDRSATMFANAALSAGAEGGAFIQALDSWIDTSAIGLFNHANDDNVRFYKATASNVASIMAASTDYSAFEIANLNDYFLNANPTFEGIIPNKGKTPTFTTYGTSTYFEIAPFLAYDSSRQTIAFVTTNLNKAGGGTAPADPFEAALDFLNNLEPKGAEDGYLIDDASGAITLTPPADISVGNGEFPYGLAFQRRFDSRLMTANLISDSDPGSGDLTLPGSMVHRSSAGLPPGWTHNFHVRANLANDPSIVMRPSGDALYATGVIAAVQALSDLARDGLTFERSLTGIFLAQVLKDSIQTNVLNVNVGGDTLAFFKKIDGTYIPVGARTASVTFASGDRLPYVTYAGGSGHRYENYNFTVKLEDGSQLNFSSAGYDIYYLPNIIINAGANEFKLDQWSFPTGMQVYYQYADNSGFPSTRRYNLTKVSNSFGYQLLFSNTTAAYSGYVLTVSDGAGRSAGVVKQESLEGDNSTFCFAPADGKASCYLYKGAAANSIVSDPGKANFGSRQRLEKVYLPADVSQSSSYTITAANPTLEISYNEASQVRSVWNQLREQSDFYVGKVADERRSWAKRISPINAQGKIEFNERGLRLVEIDPVGETTSHEYDAIGRETRTTSPEGNVAVIAYDSRHNVTSKQITPKPGSSDPILTVSYQYSDLSWPRQMTAMTDARNATTNFTYNATTGLLTEMLQPADVLGIRPRWTYNYTTFGRLDSITDATSSVSKFTYYPISAGTMTAHQNGELMKATDDFGGLNLATQLTYDAIGNILSVDYPRTDVTDVVSFDYDDARRLLQQTGQLGEQTNYHYTIEGLLDRVEAATGNSGAPWAVTTYQYDAVGRLKVTVDPDDFATQKYYDAAGQLVVTVDAEGRKTRTVYDPAGRVLKVIRAWAGSTSGGGATTNCAIMRSDTATDPTKLQQCYQEYAYTPNGQIASVRDAKGNKTTYVYDGHDRLDLTQFPSKTAVGLSDPADYEDYGYDNNGNMISKRARDGRVIAFTYDKLNRLTQRVVPGSGDASGNYETFDFTYDLAGRQLTNNHWGTTITNTYDAVGRLVSKKHNNAKPISYDYDPAGNVAHLTYPDGFVVRYLYDALNRVERVQQVNAPTDTGYVRQFAHVGYDALSRRSFLRYLPNSFSTAATYGYSMRGDLLCQEWNFAGARPPQCDAAPNANAPELAWDFSYNGVGQLVSEAVSDPLQGWLPQALGTDDYVANGLNQYSSIAGAAIVHDGNGNVTTDHRGRAYVYSAENQLYTVYQGATLLAQNVYYGDGNRRYVNSTSGGLKRFYYDGDQEIAEYNAANTNIVRRYIRLPDSIDEPLLMIDYSLNTNCTLTSDAACQRWAHQNRLGSVIAVTDSAGAVVERHKYGPYGEIGGSSSGFPFRFTGQKIDPETTLYHYKARFYDPEIGRFPQPDPIGYEDQMNLYAYAHNDPVGGTDQSGTDTTTCTSFGEQLECNVRRNDHPDTISFDGSAPIDLGGEDNDFSLEQWGEIIAYTAAGEGINFSGGSVREFGMTGDQAQDMIALTAIASAALGARGSGAASGRVGTGAPAVRPRPQTNEIVGSAQKADAYHRAATFYRAEALKTMPRKFRGGDGTTYYEYTIRGEVNGKPGTFNYIYDESGNLTHQKFNPD